jgi:flagellar hook-associated protein 1 FlgK
MDSYSIGITGLNAAQKAFEIIGNNIANAATEGYHRQELNLTPSYSSQVGSVLFGGGVDIAGVSRIIDNLLEQEILRQQSSLGQVSQELSTLQTIENTFGELSSEDGGLSTAIDGFFNALQELSSHPSESIWQEQAVATAETMAGQFRTLGEFLSTLENQITVEAENIIEQVNLLIGRVAELNDSIESQEVTGGQANNLRDQRDQCISELSELIGVEALSREYGTADLCAAGIPVVTNTSALELEVGFKEGLGLGITVAGSTNYQTEIEGGQLGGLLLLKNEVIAEIHEDMDNLANAIIQQINQYHVQGVGSEGSFTELTGWTIINEDLASFEHPVSDGNIFIRVIDTSTGAVTRTAVPVDVSTDSLSTIADAISSITGLNASVYNSKLHIQADSGYEFDFLPAVLSEPTASTLTGGTPPTISVSGIYTGTENDTYRFTVSGAGSVGNGDLQLEVRTEGGTGGVITTVNIGDGYAAGDQLEIYNGIKITISSGDFGAGDNFDVDVFADTDTSGVLAAVGINTFFSGSSALDMAVCSDIADTPRRIAASLSAEMTDNTNAVRMADLKDQALVELGTLTLGEFYRRLTTSIGQELSIQQMRQDNIQAVVQNLANQQSETSGVDINDEAAQMLAFEQIFKAMSKYLNAIQTSLSTMMDML